MFWNYKTQVKVDNLNNTQLKAILLHYVSIQE